MTQGIPCYRIQLKNEAPRCKCEARCRKKYYPSMTTFFNVGIVILSGIVLYCDLVQLTQKIKRRASNMQRGA